MATIVAFEDGDEELTSNGQVAPVDIAQIVIPRTGARVGAGLLQTEAVEFPHSLTV